ncbi:MAG: PAS domain S-box protein [Gallionellaceae bacterium]|nr:PAS domain S-box protein [Gallionellaceae bacterium]
MSQENATGWMSDLSIARALTWRYAIALSLVAMLSTAAWISLHLVISEQKSTAAVVNVSGRQRMLSQRTAFFSNLLLNTPKAKRAAVRGKLKDAIDLMARSHYGLTHGDKEMGLPDTLSPAVRAMYFEGSNPLDVQVEAYIKTVQELLKQSDAALTPENPALRYITKTAPTTLVSALDQMVRLYQLEGEASVGRLQKAETIFWLVTLLLLMLEAWLIFHPFVLHVRSIIGKLQQVTDELKLHQGHLQELVQQRTLELESRGMELVESEEKFRLISTAAQDAIAIIGTDEQIIYWNPAAEKIFGYTADEAVGKNLHTLLIPLSQRDLAHSGFKGFQQSGEGKLIGKTFEISAMRKSGEEFPVELSISAIRLKNSWHALGIIRDISERRKIEVALQEKTQALTSSNADLEQFAYSVSHDMRQPLRAVAGHLQLLEIGLRESLDEDNRENLAFALAGAKRMDSMIVSLLEYSRVGRKADSKQWIGSRVVLDEALEFLEPAILQSRAEIKVSGEWPLVFVSSDELLRLFQNLIGNAVHYHEVNQAPLIEIDSAVVEHIWCVRVRDDGIGIDPRQADRLFQFFSRLQVSERFEGAGMGLALCRRIVEHHQGRIWVESEGEGKGSAFIFELPMLPDPVRE